MERAGRIDRNLVHPFVHPFARRGIMTYRNLRRVAWTAAACVVIPSAIAAARDPFTEARHAMVEKAVAGAGVKNPRVIRAMKETPRHEFVPVSQRRYAYYDMALPIGESQTISPPFIVAYMTESIDPQPTDKVLEIGTGSGYQAAVLGPLVDEVYTIEIVPSLGRQAARTLKRLRYDNVHAKVGDGFQGWPQHAPFDKIIVTCSPEQVPKPLVAQLKEGGRIVIPVGERYQQMLYLFTKKQGELVQEALRPTLFVPMTGTAEEQRHIRPDPANPAVQNGGFEQGVGDPPTPAGWHYQRQLEWVEDEGAPEGKHYVTFSNAEPGRASQALQGFAVDGRAVRELAVSLKVRAEGVRSGQNPRQVPVLGLTFFDEKRAVLGQKVVGPWLGTLEWRPETHQIDVPPRAREAVLRIGLLGAVGEISFDALEVKAVDDRR
jgi:protein-L-isoaspartate(D-aspartate) O-methyltransferase